jgi:hypothetical protein
VWLLENNKRMAEYGYGREQLAEILDSAGYDIATYDADANRMTFGDAGWRRRHDIFAVSRSKREEVLCRLLP